MNRAAAITLYATCIVLANWLTSSYGLVPIGFGLVATAGTYAAGAALLARDIVQRVAGIPLTLAAMGIGVVLSFVLSDPRVALASAVAFGTAELVDLLVFTPIDKARGFVPGALVSNAVSAPVDTLVFLAIAGFPITAAALGGQLVGKLLWATVVPLALYVAAQRATRARTRAT